MSRALKIWLTIFILSILTPYFVSIFFSLTTSIFTILQIYFIATTFLITATYGTSDSEKIESRKKYYRRIAIGSIILFFFNFGFKSDATYWVFFKLRQRELTTFVTELKNYKVISQMTDGQRYWKSVNNTSIESNIQDVDTTGAGLGKKYLLDDILQRDGIERQHYEFFKNILITTKLESFTTLEDGTISFTIDGFLDNCYGIAYSETGRMPIHHRNDCGDIISWEKITDNWYAWQTT